MKNFRLNFSCDSPFNIFPSAPVSLVYLFCLIYPWRLGLLLVYKHGMLKGTVSRDFSSPVFFIKKFLLVPMGMCRNDFKFFRIFVDLFVFGDEYTRESIRIPEVRQFCQTSITCPESNLRFISRMIVPLKIAVWSLKLVKRLPGVENDSSVMNSPGSLNSPVQKNFMLTNRPGSQDSSMYYFPGSLDFPMCFALASF
jgi:hypothetical protein